MVSRVDDEDVANELHRVIRLAQADAAEEAVLGAVVYAWEEAWPHVEGVLEPTDFHDVKRARIFEAFLMLRAQSRDIDLATVQDALGREIEAVGGAQYLHKLTSENASRAHLASWVTAVAEAAAKRRGQRAAIEFLATVQCEPNFADAVTAAVALGPALETASTARAGVTAVDGISMVFDRMAITVTGKLIGHTTGFRDIDAVTSGERPGQFIVIGARPAMGKTSFVIRKMVRAAKAALRDQVRGVFLFFSLEMPTIEIMSRMLSQEVQINDRMLTSGRLSGDAMANATQVAGEIAKLPIVIYDTVTDLEEIRAICQRMRLKYGAVLGVTIDYLQLVTVRYRRGEAPKNRNDTVSEISKSLKGLAKQLGCAVTALSQLNRGLETRPNKRPLLADLRESGSIEQDADLVAFLYRDEVYNKTSTERGICEYIVAKQRGGPTGTVRLTWIGHTTSHEDRSSVDDGLKEFEGATQNEDGDTAVHDEHGTDRADDFPDANAIEF